MQPRIYPAAAAKLAMRKQAGGGRVKYPLKGKGAVARSITPTATSRFPDSRGEGAGRPHSSIPLFRASRQRTRFYL